MSDAIFPLSSMPGVVCERRASFYGDAVQEGDTGTEFRINRYAGPRYRYEFEARFLRGSLGEWSTLQGWFTAHRGRTESFLLVDPVDGLTRRVRFNDPELALERIVDGIYSASFELVTVVG